MQVLLQLGPLWVDVVGVALGGSCQNEGSGDKRCRWWGPRVLSSSVFFVPFLCVSLKTQLLLPSRQFFFVNFYVPRLLCPLLNTLPNLPPVLGVPTPTSSVDSGSDVSVGSKGCVALDVESEE